MLEFSFFCMLLIHKLQRLTNTEPLASVHSDEGEVSKIIPLVSFCTGCVLDGTQPMFSRSYVIDSLADA